MGKIWSFVIHICLIMNTICSFFPLWVFLYCFVVTFAGHPFAIISWIGLMIAIFSYNAVSTILFLDTDNSFGEPIVKLILIGLCLGVAIVGHAGMAYGGVNTMQIWNAALNLHTLGFFYGVLYGVFIFRT